MSQKLSQLQAWAVKVHWGGEAVLSQHQTGAFIPAVYRHRGAAYARMKPATPTFQTHSGLPCPAALHSRYSLFIRCLSPFIATWWKLLCYHGNKPPPPHCCTSLQCSDLLPKDGAPHLNAPWGRDLSHRQRCPVGVLQQKRINE